LSSQEKVHAVPTHAYAPHPPGQAHWCVVLQMLGDTQSLSEAQLVWQTVASQRNAPPQSASL
jgi:hypothetical protein